MSRGRLQRISGTIRTRHARFSEDGPPIQWPEIQCQQRKSTVTASAKGEHEMRARLALVPMGVLLVALAAFADSSAAAEKGEPIPHGQDFLPGPALSPAEAIQKMKVPEGFRVE